jgi:hypothetical protein
MRPVSFNVSSPVSSCCRCFSPSPPLNLNVLAAAQAEQSRDEREDSSAAASLQPPERGPG